MKSAIERYTRKPLRRLRRLLDSRNTTINDEELHHIRVEIKKIKAVCKLLHFHNKKFDDRRVFKLLRKIFRACGKMRDRNLHHDLAKQITGKTLLPLSDNAADQQKFTKRIPKYLRYIDNAEKSILNETKTLRFSTHRRYLKKRRRALEQILYPSFHQTGLHAARKVIKEILYLSSIVLKKHDIHPFYENSALVIGDWHDKMMLIEKLSASDKQHKVAIGALRVKCNDDLKSLKALIIEYYA